MMLRAITHNASCCWIDPLGPYLWKMHLVTWRIKNFCYFYKCLHGFLIHYILALFSCQIKDLYLIRSQTRIHTSDKTHCERKLDRLSHSIFCVIFAQLKYLDYNKISSYIHRYKLVLRVQNPNHVYRTLMNKIIEIYEYKKIISSVYNTYRN